MVNGVWGVQIIKKTNMQKEIALDPWFVNEDIVKIESAVQF